MNTGFIKSTNNHNQQTSNSEFSTSLKTSRGQPFMEDSCPQTADTRIVKNQMRWRDVELVG